MSSVELRKVKFREYFCSAKWEQIDVGDREGHIVGCFQARAIIGNTEGKRLFDGWTETDTGAIDLDSKTFRGTGHGYEVWTDPDGDKIIVSWEGTTGPGGGGPHTILSGTGKWQGIRGTGTYSLHPVSGVQWYVDMEMDIEFPKR